MTKSEKLLVHPFEIEVHYKKMKHIYLRIKPDGKVVISAPLGTSKEYVSEFVKSRLEWIKKKQQKIAMHKAISIALGEGEILLFGEPFKGKLSEAKLQGLLHERIASYYEKYWRFFEERGCKSVEIKYRMMKSTWGVCRPTARTITFNKRLIHQPARFIEYVVLHEMCHLLVPNHSKDFYQLVAYHMPCYKQHQDTRIIYDAQQR